MSDPYFSFYDFLVDHTDEVPLLLACVDEVAGRAAKILECGAGTGRIALPLAREGHRVTALDTAPEALEILSQKPGAAGIETVEGDFCRPPLLPDRRGHFDAVIFSSNTITLAGDGGRQQQALSAAFELLRPGGLLYLEQFNPPGFFNEAFRQREVYHLYTRVNPATGVPTARFMSFLHDPVRQHLYATTIVEEFLHGKPSQRYHFVEHSRYAMLPEWTLRLNLAGFTEIEASGGCHGEPLQPRSLKMVLTTRRPE